MSGVPPWFDIIIITYLISTSLFHSCCSNFRHFIIHMYSYDSILLSCMPLYQWVVIMLKQYFLHKSHTDSVDMSDEVVIKTATGRYLDIDSTEPYEIHTYLRSSLYSPSDNLDIPESAGGESWYWKTVRKDAKIVAGGVTRSARYRLPSYSCHPARVRIGKHLTRQATSVRTASHRPYLLPPAIRLAFCPCSS